jgi:hypothetical protein
MPSYILKATGAIRYNRRNVGRVVRATNGLWVAEIGQHRVTDADKSTAFREVAALAAGYANLAAMRAHNAQVRRSNAAARAHQRAIYPTARRMWAAEAAARAAAAPMDANALIAQIQRDAIEMGETPLTAEEIRNTWINRRA